LIRAALSFWAGGIKEQIDGNFEVRIPDHLDVRKNGEIDVNMQFMEPSSNLGSKKSQ
jgi:hypothetical protein